jgi:GNAT superfamily N-acetyltransferase
MNTLPPQPPGVPPDWTDKKTKVRYPILRHIWTYLGPDNATVLGYVVRYDTADAGDKVCIPFFEHREDGKWKSGGAPPLYGTHTIDDNGDVFITEGQKCTAALHGLGLPAVTSGSCASAKKTDWTPIGRVQRVFVLPDNDEAGEAYFLEVVSALAALPGSREVFRVNLPNLPDKGDVVDWLQARVRGWDGFARIPREPGDGLLEEFLETVRENSQVVSLATLQHGDGCGGINTPLPLLPEESPEPFPAEALGEVLGGAAGAIHETVQAPLAMCCNSVLAAAALATQPYGDVYIPSVGRRPISEFFLTVGESGERKSTVDRWALFAVYEHCADLRQAHFKARQEFNMAMDTYRIAKRQALAAHKKSSKEAIAAALQELGPAPTPRATPVLISDLTLEGLRDLLDKGCAAVGVFTDEGGTMTGGHAMLPENQLKTLAGMSEFWDGKAHTIVRKLEGTCVLAGRRVSMHLMMQPAVAAQLLDNPLANGQGFLSRCLCVWPTSTAGTRVFRSNDLLHDARIIQYNERMRELLKTQPRVREGNPCELEPDILQFDSKAQEVLITFYNEVEKQVGPDGEHRAIKALANKAMEHAARLAGILTVFEGVDGTVSADTMRRACDLVRFYLEEALRIKGVGQDVVEREQADRLLRWLQFKGLSTFCVRDIQRGGPPELRARGMARAALKVLEEHGYAQALDPKRISWRLINADEA